MALLAPAAAVQADAPLPPGVSTDEARAMVAEVIRDAETRSSLLADGATAGHDGKFFLASSDGNYRLNVGGVTQTRYVANFRDDADSDDFDGGFQMRRVKLDLTGNVISPGWTFQVLSNFSRSTGNFTLEQAWVRNKLSDEWAIRFGQFKVPFLREELVTDAKVLAAERSLVNSAFSQDRSQGVQLEYASGSFRFTSAFSDGLDSENTDLGSPPPESDWATTARIDFVAAGDFKRFDDHTSAPGSTFAALLGAAVHAQQTPNSSAPTDTDTTLLAYTLDASLEGDSWNAYGAFIGFHAENETTGPTDPADTDDFGALVQFGYRITERTELFARWEAIFLDDTRVSAGEDDFHFVTVGCNYFIAGHALRFTLDAVIALEETTNLVGQRMAPGLARVLPNTGVGLQGSAEEGEVALRAQFQLVF